MYGKTAQVQKFTNRVVIFQAQMLDSCRRVSLKASELTILSLKTVNISFASLLNWQEQEKKKKRGKKKKKQRSLAPPLQTLTHPFKLSRLSGLHRFFVRVQCLVPTAA